MKILYVFIVLVFLFIVFTNWMPQYSKACTAFQINYAGNIYVGKNYDWIVGNGHIIVNKRGVSKTAIPTFFDKDYESERFVNWVSRYGSVTFNQFGREWPFGGINEAGLVVEALAFPDTETPKPDTRPSISALQLCQFLLDNYSTVADVINSEKSLRIMPSNLPAGHLFIADSRGNSAVIEYIDGKQVYYSNDSMPYKILTNSAYKKSIDYYKKHKKPWRDKGKSIERFITAAKMLQDYDANAITSPLDFSFKMLGSISWKEERSIGQFNILMETKWSIVYDVNRLHIYFRTNNSRNIRKINLRSFNFTCTTPVKVLDINEPSSGDVTNEFIDYTQQTNTDLIKASFKKTPYPFLYGLSLKSIFHFVKSGFRSFPNFPPEDVATLSTYPDTTVCIK